MEWVHGRGIKEMGEIGGMKGTSGGEKEETGGRKGGKEKEGRGKNSGTAVHRG